MTSNQSCGGDLIDAMKRLAENDTLEILQISYSNEDTKNCTFQERPTLESAGMRHFSHLKTVKIMRFRLTYEGHEYVKECKSFQSLYTFGAQIFSNVECLQVDESMTEHITDLIKFSTKLRHLHLTNNYNLTSRQAAEILSTLEAIFQGRKSLKTDVDDDDFIEIKFCFEKVFELFAEIDSRSDSIKLSVDYSLFSQFL